MAHAKNINKLKQYYELGAIKERPADLCGGTSTNQQRGIRRPAVDRNGQHDKPADNRQG